MSLPLSPSPDGNPDFGYAAHIQSLAMTRPKGERTRARIMAAVCDLLQIHAPQDVTIPVLCKSVGIAYGTIYVHFPDREALMSEVLSGFVGFLQTSMRHASASVPPDAIRAATFVYYEMFRANTGLMKCLLHHHDTFPAARLAFHRLNRDWIEHVVASAERQHIASGTPLARDELLRRGHALGGMVDQFLSGLFLTKDPAIVQVSHDQDKVLDSLCLIWQRGLEL